MENIKKIAKKLSEKNSWVRKETGELMEKWKEVSACEEIIFSETSIMRGVNDTQLFLCANEADLKCWNQYGVLQDYDSESYFFNSISMSKLREFLGLFSTMVKEIEAKMEENLKKNEEFEDFFKKINS